MQVCDFDLLNLKWPYTIEAQHASLFNYYPNTRTIDDCTNLCMYKVVCSET